MELDRRWLFATTSEVCRNPALAAQETVLLSEDRARLRRELDTL
jgi:hypothetical protein